MSTTAGPGQPVPPPPIGQGVDRPPPPPFGAPPHPYVHQGAGPHPPVAANGTRFVAYLLDWVLMMVTLGIGWLVWAAITAADGQTPGKKVMKLKVWDLGTNAPMTWGKMVLLRGVLFHGIVAGFIYVFTLGITLLMPLWDKRNQTVVDKMSSSVVVQVG